MDAVVRIHLKPEVFLCAPVHCEHDLWSDLGWLPMLSLWLAAAFQPVKHSFQRLEGLGFAGGGEELEMFFSASVCVAFKDFERGRGIT